MMQVEMLVVMRPYGFDNLYGILVLLRQSN